MKKEFAFSLTGADWWRSFLVYWIIYAALTASTMLLPRWVSVSVHPAAYNLIVFGLVIGQVLDQAIFLIVALRILVPKISVDGREFHFRGSVWTFLGISVVGTLLSIITLTVYAPWFARRITAYLVSEVTVDGASPEFLGRGGKLFVYMLLAFWIPLAVLIAIAVLLGAVSAREGSAPRAGAVTAVTYLVMVLVFILLIPFFYLTYKWCVNISWSDTTISWRTRFWPSVGFLLGQVLLMIVTLGIYWPAAVLRIYRYFVGRTALRIGERETGRLGFDAPIGKGFGLVWGQTLLSIITAGVYLPWAIAKVYQWVIGASYVDTANDTPS